MIFSCNLRTFIIIIVVVFSDFTKISLDVDKKLLTIKTKFNFVLVLRIRKIITSLIKIVLQF